jgi:hypothetical protein
VSLKEDDGCEWILTRRVNGEYRPFSYSVRKLKRNVRGIHTKNNNYHDVAKDGDNNNDEVFVVRDQLFKHNGKFYMLANHPEGKHWNEHLHNTSRYVSRLDDFPYTELTEVDYQDRDLRDKIKRLRGTPVGETSGLGIEEKGHQVRVDDELHDVGLFIAAISYLIYASG